MSAAPIRLHVEDTGGSGPAVVFSHGLLWSTKMWRFQFAALRDRYRCIAWDHRGQGKSEVTASGNVPPPSAADSVLAPSAPLFEAQP